MAIAAAMWDAPYMDDGAPTSLQLAVREAIDASGRARDALDSAIGKLLKTKGKPLYDIERGKSRRPTHETLRAIEQVLRLEPDQLVHLVYARPAGREPDLPPARDGSAGETVEIIQLDLSLPMGSGATIDDYIEEEPRVFDLAYIRGFTRTPPHRLRIARGVGDSMFPTLQSNDLVWIDSTQTVLNQSDRVWAVSINGAAAIKRLRPLKGGRVLVMSDNKTIGDYEVDHDELRIGGRVIRFARDV